MLLLKWKKKIVTKKGQAEKEAFQFSENAHLIECYYL